MTGDNETRSPMIDLGKRQPHDEKTPEETIDWVIQDWDKRALRGVPQPPLASAIIDALVYKAFFEEAEGALRWLDPVTDDPHITERIGIRAEGEFCNECGGPYDGWLQDQYGGHWDTCPNRTRR